MDVFMILEHELMRGLKCSFVLLNEVELDVRALF